MKGLLAIGVCVSTSLLVIAGTPSVSFAGSQYDPDFPDIIICKVASYDVHYTLYQSVNDAVGGWWDVNPVVVYNNISFPNENVGFDLNGDFQYATGHLTGEDCDGFSIADLYTNGQAFDFGSGSGGGGSGATTTVIYYSSSTPEAVNGLLGFALFSSWMVMITSLVASIWIFRQLV